MKPFWSRQKRVDVRKDDSASVPAELMVPDIIPVKDALDSISE